jgi:hypothetical protein
MPIKFSNFFLRMSEVSVAMFIVTPAVVDSLALLLDLRCIFRGVRSTSGHCHPSEGPASH